MGNFWRRASKWRSFTESSYFAKTCWKDALGSFEIGNIHEISRREPKAFNLRMRCLCITHKNFPSMCVFQEARKATPWWPIASEAYSDANDEKEVRQLFFWKASFQLEKQLLCKYCVHKWILEPQQNENNSDVLHIYVSSQADVGTLLRHCPLLPWNILMITWHLFRLLNLTQSLLSQPCDLMK